MGEWCGNLLSRRSLDRGLKDRHGRAVEVNLAWGGKACPLTAEGLETALRLRRELSARPAVCAAAMKKFFGFAADRVEVKLWNGKKLAFSSPADLGAFLGDVNGIILRDQYNVAGVAGKTVADCGANLGLFSLYAHALGAKKVYAFEAVEETFALLKGNLRLNGSPSGIKAACAALGAAPGRAEIRFNTRGEGSAMIGGADTVNAAITYAARRAVLVRPLDSLLKGRLDFIKIDVEGFEGNVLLGAAGLIRRCKPVISCAAYHRPEDKAALRKTLAAIQPGYTARLKTWAEHDLYCEYK